MFIPIPFTTSPLTLFDVFLIFLLICWVVPHWEAAGQRLRERDREREEWERQMGLRRDG